MHHALVRIAARARWARLLNAIISGCTEAVIWLSTWGTSAKMSKALTAARSIRARG
jgi:hypothetical protein